MYYHIITNCGRTITRRIKRMSADRQRHMRHAMIGAATRDDQGQLIDIKDVRFSNTATPPQ